MAMTMNATRMVLLLLSLLFSDARGVARAGQKFEISAKRVSVLVRTKYIKASKGVCIWKAPMYKMSIVESLHDDDDDERRATSDDNERRQNKQCTMTNRHVSFDDDSYLLVSLDNDDLSCQYREAKRQ
jgi:hypothetical protein